MSDYQNDVKIDADALDIEWVRHPAKYMKWAERAAHADKNAKAKKEKLDLVYAKIDNELREVTEKKITEKMIESQIYLDERYKKASEEWREAIYDANVLQSAVRAMEQKKSALENLVKLWAGAYFSGPKSPRDIREEIDIKDKAESRNRERQREALNRNRDEKKQ